MRVQVALPYLADHINAIATDTLGAYRWFNLGPLGTFQPAEVLKFALLLFLSGFLGRRYNQGKINDLQDTVYPAAALSALALFVVVVLQKDMGTGMAMASMIATMFVVSKVRWKTLLGIAAVCTVLAVLAVVTAPHRMERIRELNGITFINDSIASSPTRTIAGLHALPKPPVIILGGHDKHIPFDTLGDEVCLHAKAAVVVGETAQRIAARAITPGKASRWRASPPVQG